MRSSFAAKNLLTSSNGFKDANDYVEVGLKPKIMEKQFTTKKDF